MTDAGLAAVGESATLRAAVDRVIPGDEWPAGWAGGVGEYLTDPEGVLAWAAEPLTEFVRLLDAASTGAGFADLPARAQDDILRRASDRTVVRPLFDALLRVCWEGYYAQTRRRRPAGIDMVDFHSVPAGVRPVEPPPLPSIEPSRVAKHYDAVIVGSGPGAGAAAWTLADAGKRVLVVERAANLSNGRLRGDHLRGKRNGVYDVTVAPGAGDPRVTEDADGREVVVDGAGDANHYGSTRWRSAAEPACGRRWRGGSCPRTSGWRRPTAFPRGRAWRTGPSSTPTWSRTTPVPSKSWVCPVRRAA
jgi:hypothetical protein